MWVRQRLTIVLLGALLLLVVTPSEALAEDLRSRIHCEPPQVCHGRCLQRGFDGTFFVRDRRRRFVLRPSAYTQLRFQATRRSEGPDRTTNEVFFARTRIRFQGEATQLFDYDFRLNVNHEGDVGVLVASVLWHISDAWSLKAGRFFLAVGREDWTVPDDLLTTDFSASDDVFAPAIGQGLQAAWEGRRHRFWVALSGADLTGGNDLVGPTKFTEWALTGRYEHQWGTSDWSVWDDLTGRRCRPCGFLLGVAGGVAEGKPEIDASEGYLLSIDVSHNWDGGQAMVFGNLSHNVLRTGGTRTTWGLVAQAGQFLTHTHQLYGRYELIAPGDTAGDLVTYHTLTAGWNYLPFVWTNRIKISLEFSHLFTGINRTIVSPGRVLGFLPSDEAQSYLRLQCQFGF